jgi:hypothetical protein
MQASRQSVVTQRQVYREVLQQVVAAEVQPLRRLTLQCNHTHRLYWIEGVEAELETKAE